MNHGGNKIFSILKQTLPAALLVLAAGCTSWDGTTREVEFTGGGGIPLRGTLALPRGVQTPVPAIILLHGAERATRDRFIYPLTGNIFLEQGLAVLTYDKRGAGESGGDYETTTYEQLIEDAVATIAYLRSLEEIDGDALGLYAVSESGWLAPEIIERSGNIAFLINKVGAVVSVRDTIAWENFNDLQADGVSEASAREQTDILMRIWRWQESPDPREKDALGTVLTQWADSKDSRLPQTLTRVSEAVLADRRYDPGPFLERLSTPSLYLYGTEDINIPSLDCMVRIDELVASGRPITARLFEGEGHELGGPAPWPPFYAYTDGFADLVGTFAKRHTANR